MCCPFSPSTHYLVVTAMKENPRAAEENVFLNVIDDTPLDNVRHAHPKESINRREWSWGENLRRVDEGSYTCLARSRPSLISFTFSPPFAIFHNIPSFLGSRLVGQPSFVAKKRIQNKIRQIVSKSLCLPTREFVPRISKLAAISIFDNPSDASSSKDVEDKWQLFLKLFSNFSIAVSQNQERLHIPHMRSIFSFHHVCLQNPPRAFPVLTSRRSLDAPKTMTI